MGRVEGSRGLEGDGAAVSRVDAIVRGRNRVATSKMTGDAEGIPSQSLQPNIRRWKALRGRQSQVNVSLAQGGNAAQAPEITWGLNLVPEL